MPEIIFAIFNGYEYRTYTTILSFATAINDGYASGPNCEVKVFVPADWADDSINVGVKKIAKRKACPNLPLPSDFKTVMDPAKSLRPQKYQSGHWPYGIYESDQSPVQKKYLAAWERKQKAHRKKYKDKIAADLIAALGRTF